MRILIIILLIVSQVKAQNVNLFTQYASNPIITKHTGAWDSVDIANPDVFYDTPNSRWVMDYSGYGIIPSLTDTLKWRTGLAYSTDLLTWTKDPLNPVFSPTAAEGYIGANCSIVLRGSTYYMFYNTSKIDGTQNYIRLATSTDLHTWTRQNSGAPIILPSEYYDNIACYDPCVRLMPDGETFELFYSAKSTLLPPNNAARAISTDGITWVKQGIIMGGQSWFNPNVNFAEAAGTRYNGGLYLTWDAPLIADHRKIGGAVSYNSGRDWRYFGFLVNNATGWNSAQVFDSNLIFYNGVAYLFFAGSPTVGCCQNLGAQIGVATGIIIQ